MSGGGDSINSSHNSDGSTRAVTNNNNNNNNKEVDGKALAIQLGSTLLELSLTLAASYYFSKWLARKIQGDATSSSNMGGYTDEAVDGSLSIGGVLPRLKKLLEARHEATLQAMMDELKDHQLSWRGEEEKKEGSDIQLNTLADTNGGGGSIDDDDEQRCLEQQTRNQYAQLEQELIQQHETSLSTLNSLSSYEMSIAQSNVIDPTNIAVKFSDIGGMDHIKSEIYDLVVLPLIRPDLFISDSGLVSPPKGILLYGPPGTGKTMLAKAIAKESHATFVNVQLSTIMNKWFGESNKLISAVFGLSKKLAPSVVFIDEIDAFLSQRDGTEGSAVNSMKSEFLTLWDGLLSERPKKKLAVKEYDGEEEGRGWRRRSSKSRSERSEEPSTSVMLPTPPIIVLGATNRPYDVDPAILRRLPRSFEISLPNYNSRLQLLNLFLEKQCMTPEAKTFLPKVAEMTVGYSGSDLKEVCRAAAWEPVREMTSGASRRAVGVVAGGTNSGGIKEKMLRRTSSGFPPRGTKARPVKKNDFILAVQKVKKTGDSAKDFHKREVLRGRDEQMEMAAEIRNIPVGGKGKKKKKPQSVNSQHPTQHAQQIDIQQLMNMAMAAASSMNQAVHDVDGQNAALHEEDDDNDEDAPPEIFVDATC